MFKSTIFYIIVFCILCYVLLYKLYIFYTLSCIINPCVQSSTHISTLYMYIVGRPTLDGGVQLSSPALLHRLEACIVQKAALSGLQPDFKPETRHVHHGRWLPQHKEDRKDSGSFQHLTRQVYFLGGMMQTIKMRIISHLYSLFLIYKRFFVY